MLNHRWSSAVLLRVEPDGTKVYCKNHRILRVTEDHGPGFYPGGSRAAMHRLTKSKDVRNTREFAEFVRERRQQGYKAGVKPGPQSL